MEKVVKSKKELAYARKRLSFLNVQEKIADITIKNKGLIADRSSMQYICLTCGNVGLSHPDTSCCFRCDDDNWELRHMLGVKRTSALF